MKDATKLSIIKAHVIKTEYFMARLEDKKKQWKDKKVPASERTKEYIHCIDGLKYHLNKIQAHLNSIETKQTEFARKEVKSYKDNFIGGDKI